MLDDGISPPGSSPALELSWCIHRCCVYYDSSFPSSGLFSPVFYASRLYAAGAQNDLMEVYREFGLHSMTPSSLVPENTCEDELFARDHLYNSSLKDYDHPVG